MPSDSLIRRSILASAICAVVSFPAPADELLTGGKTGAYFNDIGPRVHERLTKGLFRYPLKAGKGTGGNFDAIAENPFVVALGQADGYALRNLASPSKVVSIPTGVRECLFAVTKNEQLAGASPGEGWGNIRATARRMRVGLPGETSGPSLSWQFIKSFDDRIARIRDANVTHFDSVDKAIDAAARDEVDIAFFVQMPDTNNPRFAKIKDLGLNWIGIGDRNMLKQTVPGPDGQPRAVYFVDSVPIQSTFAGFGSDIVLTTTCTDVLILTGDPNQFQDPGDKGDMSEQVSHLASAPDGSYEPTADWFTNMKSKVRGLAGDELDAFFGVIDKASEAVKESVN